MIQNIFSTAKHMRGTQQQYIKEGDGRQQAICKQYNHCFYHCHSESRCCQEHPDLKKKKKIIYNNLNFYLFILKKNRNTLKICMPNKF